MKRLVLITLLAVSMASAGWWRTYGGPDTEIGNCVQITSDGNYIISCKRNDDVWLIETDTSGNILWDQVYSLGTSYGNVSRWLEETSDGGYIIAPSIPSLLKVNAQGDSLWAKDFGMWSYCVQKTPEGDYIVVGDYNLTQLGLIKTNTQGDSLWVQRYGGVTRNWNAGYFVQVASDSGYIITGVTGFQTEEYTSGAVWLLKTNNTGDTLWTRLYGGDGYDLGFCVDQTQDSGYIVVGQTTSYGAGSGDVYLLKTDSLGLLAIREESVEAFNHNWEVVSSMGSNIILKYLDHPGGFQALVYDATGRMIDEIRSNEISGCMQWGRSQPSGVYFIHASQNNGYHTERVLIIH